LHCWLATEDLFADRQIYKVPKWTCHVWLSLMLIHIPIPSQIRNGQSVMNRERGCRSGCTAGLRRPHDSCLCLAFQVGAAHGSARGRPARPPEFVAPCFFFFPFFGGSVFLRIFSLTRSLLAIMVVTSSWEKNNWLQYSFFNKKRKKQRRTIMAVGSFPLQRAVCVPAWLVD
jgi:hypothetical protein